jgi:prepilin-type N-terminal cleavage/methylation domain-containing protein
MRISMISQVFNRKRQKGFTLIELVIVLIIIGILAGVLVPKYQDLVDRAKEAKLKALVANVQTALRVTVAQRMLDDTIPSNEKQPTVIQLADNIEGGEAETRGIGVTVSGEDYTILTYTGEGCELSRDGNCVDTGDGCIVTSSAASKVYCVSGYEPPVS